jgi:proline iminopeptidase
MTDRLGFFPELQPYARGRLKVSDLHEIYFEECGNPSGKPVVILHGGPGGGISVNLRRFHNPSAYRMILFDQRGCGASTPYACLEENTTWDLVSDIEKLRLHLGIERWQVFGGSWGSTLALAYAETHAERVTELIMRGIFTARKKEIDWLYQSGASMLFPEFWEDYVRPIPEDERHDFVAAYHKRLTGDDGMVKLACARDGANGRVLFLHCCQTLNALCSLVMIILQSRLPVSNAITLLMADLLKRMISCCAMRIASQIFRV